MTFRKARLHLDPAGICSSIEVDGHKLPGVRGVTIAAPAKGLTELRIDLIAYEIEIDGLMRVELPSSTREALIALGWTPPLAEEGTAG